MSSPRPSQICVDLLDQERAVLTNALTYYLDGPIEEADHPQEDLRAVLTSHLETATEQNCIYVDAGMDDLYQSIFRAYAQALQETIEEDDDHEAMATFFEDAFKGVIEKIRMAVGSPDEF